MRKIRRKRKKRRAEHPALFISEQKMPSEYEEWPFVEKSYLIYNNSQFCYNESAFPKHPKI